LGTHCVERNFQARDNKSNYEIGSKLWQVNPRKDDGINTDKRAKLDRRSKEEWVGRRDLGGTKKKRGTYHNRGDGEQEKKKTKTSKEEPGIKALGKEREEESPQCVEETGEHSNGTLPLKRVTTEKKTWRKLKN